MPLTILPSGPVQNDPTIEKEGVEFKDDLLKWNPYNKKRNSEYEYKQYSPTVFWKSTDQKKEEIKQEDGYNPLVFF
jgi:hypothetical protein